MSASKITAPLSSKIWPPPDRLMSASKLLDFIGHLPGFALQQADAVAAYTQAPYKGPPCWLIVPKSRWPPEWFGPDGKPLYRVPCVLLLVALYGHPQSAALWEDKCTTSLSKAGFEKIADWESCFIHRELGLVLSVYVMTLRWRAPNRTLLKDGPSSSKACH